MACKLCGNPITRAEDWRGFPPFVTNEADRLYEFSDSNLHIECFQRHPLAREAEHRLSLVRESSLLENRRSYISGKAITDHDDYIPMGYITANKSDPLYEFNLKHFSKSELKTWPKTTWLIEQLRRLASSGEFKGMAIVWLIDQLDQLIRPVESMRPVAVSNG
jgi:hypothetical protein